MLCNEWHLPEGFDLQDHAIAWGSIGEAPPAVVLHGTPFSSVEWRRIAAIMHAVSVADMAGEKLATKNLSLDRRQRLEVLRARADQLRYQLLPSNEGGVSSGHSRT